MSDRQGFLPPEQLQPESRELLTLIFHMQKVVLGLEEPIMDEYHAPVETERLVNVQAEVIEVLSTLLTQVGIIAGVDLSASWQHLLEERLRETGGL